LLDANYLANTRDTTMNMSVNDKLLPLATRPNASHEKKTSTVPNENEANGAAAVQKKSDDSLNLSDAGQRLQSSATAQADKARSFPETAEQASALVAKIRRQFEQSGGEALSAHSPIQSNRIDLLLRSAPV